MSSDGRSNNLYRACEHDDIYASPGKKKKKELDSPLTRFLAHFFFCYCIVTHGLLARLCYLLGRPREERDWGGKPREGINDTASGLFADVRDIYGKAKKTKQGLGYVANRPVGGGGGGRSGLWCWRWWWDGGGGRYGAWWWWSL